MPTETEEARTSRSLIDYATTVPADLYALLSLPSSPSPTPSILKKAWRTAALKHHPDKNPGNEFLAAAALDAARKAFDVLSDPSARLAYDERVRRREEKVARERQFDTRRREMREGLLAREREGRRENVRSGANTNSMHVDTQEGRGDESTFDNGDKGYGANKRRRTGGTTFSGQSKQSVATALSAEEEAELQRIAAEGARRRLERQHAQREKEEAMRRQRSQREREEDEVGDVTEVPMQARKISFGGASGKTSKDKDTETKTKTAGSNGSGEKPAASSFKVNVLQRLREAQARKEAELREAEGSQNRTAVPADGNRIEMTA